MEHRFWVVQFFLSWTVFGLENKEELFRGNNDAENLIQFGVAGGCLICAAFA